MHRRALAEIERSALQRNAVCRASHFAAQGVDFKDKVTLARAANGRIARKVGNGIKVDGEENGIHSHTRRRERGFNACVSGADDGNPRGKLLHIHPPFRI